MAKKTPMTKEAAARIQSTTAKNGENTSKKSFPARAQRGAEKTLQKEESKMDTSNMSQEELDTWSDINNPNNNADMDDWSDIHNPNNDEYIGDD